MPFTDVQLITLAQDVMTALGAFQTAQTNLAAAKKALAQAIGPGQTITIKGRAVTANADATDVTVSPQRVVV